MPISLNGATHGKQIMNFVDDKASESKSISPVPSIEGDIFEHLKGVWPEEGFRCYIDEWRFPASYSC